MPISSHCFWPCESRPARRSACGVETNQLQRLGDAVTGRRVELREKAAPDALVGLHRQFEILEHRVVLENGRLLELAADADVRNLGFGEPRQVDRLTEEDRPFVGPRLAGDDVHHRRLAGAVGADDAAQLAGVDRQRQLVERPEAVEADRDVFEIEDDLVRQVESPGFRMCPSSAVPLSQSGLSRSFCGASGGGGVHAAGSAGGRRQLGHRRLAASGRAA
jgi:hypothetical protein